MVTLDGTGSSDLEREELGYDWRQVSGRGVTLTNAQSVTATFTAPMQLAETATLVFRSDGDGRAQCEFIGRGVGRGVAGAERRAGGERGAEPDSGRRRGSSAARGWRSIRRTRC